MLGEQGPVPCAANYLLNDCQHARATRGSKSGNQSRKPRSWGCKGWVPEREESRGDNRGRHLDTDARRCGGETCFALEHADEHGSNSTKSGHPGREAKDFATRAGVWSLSTRGSATLLVVEDVGAGFFEQHALLTPERPDQLFPWKPPLVSWVRQLFFALIAAEHEAIQGLPLTHFFFVSTMAPTGV